jgi:hypothetical protein
MGQIRLLATAALVAGSLSCARANSGAKPPAAAPTPGSGVPQVGVVAPPAVPAGRGNAPGSTTTNAPPSAPPAANAPPGAPPAGGPPRRVPLTPEQRAARRDSLSAMRAQVVQDIMTQIAGNETKRAADVFKNVQLMKDTTAAQLLKTMDYYGRSLSVGCTFCHTAVGKWDDDAKEAKKTARVMIELVNAINTGGLTKLPPNRNGQTPRISCVTCHRGNTGPGTALLP